jgi:hypothetical protein
MLGVCRAGQKEWAEVEPRAKRKERAGVSFSRWPNRTLHSGHRTRALFRAPPSNHDQSAATVWAAQWCGFEDIGLRSCKGRRCPGGSFGGRKQRRHFEQGPHALKFGACAGMQPSKPAHSMKAGWQNVLEESAEGTRRVQAQYAAKFLCRSGERAIAVAHWAGVGVGGCRWRF